MSLLYTVKKPLRNAVDWLQWHNICLDPTIDILLKTPFDGTTICVCLSMCMSFNFELFTHDKYSNSF